MKKNSLLKTLVCGPIATSIPLFITTSCGQKIDKTPLCFNAIKDAGETEVSYEIVGDEIEQNGIMYSFDNEVWLEWQQNTSVKLSLDDEDQSNDRFYVKNVNNTLSKDENNYYHFITTKKVSVTNNINSMVNFSDLTDNCFYKLFSNCNIYTAPELPATNLAVGCYKDMFNGCSSLIESPKLPARKAADSCYWEMFLGCTSLTKVGKISLTKLSEGCCSSMFNSCSSLKVTNEGPSHDGSKSFFKCPDDPSGLCVNNMLSGLQKQEGVIDGRPRSGVTYYWFI